MLGLAALAGLAMVPLADAQAAVCVAMGSPPALAPAPDSEDVPLNTKLWVESRVLGELGFESVEFVLRDPAGVERSLSIQIIELLDHSLVVLSSAELLAAETRYELRVREVGADEADESVLSAFTTGTEADEDEPEPPQVRGRSESASGPWPKCGSMRVLEYDIEFEGILVADFGEGELDPALPTGMITGALSEPEPLLVGEGVYPSHWPVGIYEQASPRFASFDLAGNFSGWVEDETVELPRAGCSVLVGPSTPAAGELGLGLMTLLGLGWARRLSRRSASGPSFR